MTIRMTAVVGGDTGLLEPWLAHYQQLGVQEFHVTRHVEDPADPRVEASAAVMEKAGLAFSGVHVGPWHEHLNPRLIREEMAAHPDDWWIVADLDEFQVYPVPLTELTARCASAGHDFVSGAFLDRVAAGGLLPAPGTDGGPLWRQYPLAGLLTLRLLGARPTKVTLARGRVELGYGQHVAWTGRGAAEGEVYAQVHHFKWTDSVRESLTRRVEAYSSGAWQTNNLKIIEESRTFLDHLAANGGRIDVTEPSFGFLPCSFDHADYGPWPTVAAELSTRYLAFDAARAERRARGERL
jgi:Glycosyl transferase family 2